MRDILKKLRCGGGTSAAAKRASDAYEDPKDNETEEDQNGTNGVEEEVNEEETKQLIEGQTEEKIKAVIETTDNKEQEQNHAEEEITEKNEEEVEKKHEEEEQQQEVKEDKEDHCEAVAEDDREAEEGDNLLKEDGEKAKDKDEKKGKKKEGSRWICGLGKKSGKEKPEKKKKEEKKSKKSKKEGNEEGDKEGLTENEKKLINGDDEDSQDEGKDKSSADRHEENEEDAADEGKKDDSAKNEEVVVFVTESEAVVEEAHHTETNVETKEQCSLKGDGLNTGVKGKATSFQVISNNEDVFSFTCKVQDANGNEVAVEIENIEGNVHKATYFPSTTGIHSIEALWKGEPITGSPFQVNITENEDE